MKYIFILVQFGYALSSTGLPDSLTSGNQESPPTPETTSSDSSSNDYNKYDYIGNLTEWMKSLDIWWMILMLLFFACIAAIAMCVLVSCCCFGKKFGKRLPPVPFELIVGKVGEDKDK